MSGTFLIQFSNVLVGDFVRYFFLSTFCFTRLLGVAVRMLCVRLPKHEGMANERRLPGRHGARLRGSLPGRAAVAFAQHALCAATG